MADEDEEELDSENGDTEGDEGESSFCVRVVDDENEPVPNVEVMLSFTSLGRGVTDTIRTDDDGRAEFDGFRDGEAKVFVDGSFIETHDFSDGDELTVSI